MRSPFFLLLSIGFLGIALTGFSTTFFMPLARGSFAAPAVIYIHGTLLFGWLALLIVQASLVRYRKHPVHRRMGWIGMAMGGAIVVSGIAVGVFAARRDLATTAQSWPYGQFVNNCIEMAVFGLLVGAAILFRRQPETHKRLLVLATISALGPAWFRFRHFMPFVPNPVVTFSLVADSVLLVVIARDWLAFKRVHPVYLWAGGVMFAVHACELAFADTDVWTRIGSWLLR